MKKYSTAKLAASAFNGEAWFDPIEEGLSRRIKQFTDEFKQETTAPLGRDRYERRMRARYRNGSRHGRLLGTYGPNELSLPRGRLASSNGESEEWRSAAR